jgi:hypothetical protein
MNIKDVININHGLLTLFYIFRFNMNSISNSEKSYYKKNTKPYHDSMANIFLISQL